MSVGGSARGSANVSAMGSALVKIEESKDYDDEGFNFNVENV